jgi:hypothetical protein
MDIKITRISKFAKEIAPDIPLKLWGETLGKVRRLN